MESIHEILGTISSQLGDVANGEAVVGAPIKLGAVTLYPVSRLSIGLGGGGGSGDEVHEHGKAGQVPAKGTGGGAAGAAKARPVAVIVFSEEGVSVLPIADKKGKLDQILEKVPGLIEQIKGKNKDSHCDCEC